MRPKKKKKKSFLTLVQNHENTSEGPQWNMVVVAASCCGDAGNLVRDVWSQIQGNPRRKHVTVCKILETKAEVQLPTVQQPQVYSKATLEWFKTMNLNVLERHSQCPEIGHASELLSTEYLA